MTNFLRRFFTIPYVELFKDLKLLDIGCGHGNILRQFFPKNAVGIDNDRLILKMARERGHKNVKYANLEKGIPFKNESFEAVTAVHVIEHLKNINFLFEEVYRVLRPGGYFYIDTPAADHKFWDNPDHIRPCTLVSIKKLCQNNNFEVVKWKYSKSYLPFRNSSNSGTKLLSQKPPLSPEQISRKRRVHFPFKKWVGIVHNYLLGKIGLNRYWLKELKNYYNWKDESAFYKIYKEKQKEATTLWKKKERKTEKDIRSFYSETDFWVLRQMFIHKNNCFPEIAKIIPKNRKDIHFCEYGSGIGPVTRWLTDRFPDVKFTLVDLPTHTMGFAKWRFKKNKNVEFLTVPLNGFPLKKQYDFINCFAVLEHVTKPFETVKHLIKHLKIGGTLFIDYQYGKGKDENLPQSAAQRDKTIDFLNNNLQIVWALDKNWKKDGGFGQYIKNKEIKD